MLKFSKYWHEFVVLTSILIIALGGFVSFKNNQQLSAQSGNFALCQFGAAVTGPQPFGMVLNGTTAVTLQAYIPPGSVTGKTTDAISSVKFYAFYPDSASWISIGSATLSGSSQWYRTWDTSQALANGPVEIVARAFTGTAACETPPVNYFIDNPNVVSGDLVLEVIKPVGGSWTGNPNYSTTFEVRAKLKNSTGTTATLVDITGDTTFTWKTTIGKIDGNLAGPVVSFFSGPQEGDGEVTVKAVFNNQIRTRKINIDVRSSTTSTDTFNGDDFTSSSGTSEEDKEQVSTAPSISEDDDLKDCIIKIFGESYYKQVIRGERKMSFSELEQVSRCFASSKYLIPSTVAPIDPDKIDEVEVDESKAVVLDFQQSSDSEGNDNGVVFRGTSLPNKTILLYIYSEPLVLTTTTDENGDWTYVLEDPLEPGEHKIYVAVEDDDGNIVRSEPVSFDLDQVASVNTNPSGLSLSLSLSDPQTSSTIYYVSAVAAILLVAFASFIFIIRHKSSMIDEDTDTETNS